jgi:hypothetical protein
LAAPRGFASNAEYVNETAALLEGSIALLFASVREGLGQFFCRGCLRTSSERIENAC